MSEINKISKMSFSELLKIEFMKCKRSKIVPLIFIAPLLVVSSGIANLSSYFTPEYTNAWPAMFIQSALVYAYYLLPFSMIVVCVMIASRETGNNGILKMLALPVSRYALSAVKFCVLIFYLFMEMVVFLAVFVIGGLIATKTMGVTETLPIFYLLKWCFSLFLQCFLVLGQCGPLLSFLRNHCYRWALICFLSFQVFWLQIRLFGLLTLIATAAIWFPARCAILQQKLLILHFLYFRFCLARFLSFAWCFRWRSHNSAEKR